MIINFAIGKGQGGGGLTPAEKERLNNAVQISDYNTDKQLQSTVDESQNQAIEALDEKVRDIELFKFPNVTIFGTPSIANGQMSDFSANDYAQFPFLVDFRNQSFEINMCFTTGDDLTNQQNIIDSANGLAFAVRNGRFVIAMSSDGESWNMGEHTGSQVVTPNTTYYVKFSWDKSVYKLDVSTNRTDYVNDITVTDDRSLFAKQIIIGKGTSAHVFDGSINLNYCSLLIMGNLVWSGMDDAGLATRLATDMSNLDEAGVAKINQLIDAKFKLFVGTHSSWEALSPDEQATYTLTLLTD